MGAGKSSNYWWGNSVAKVASDQVSASWGRGNGAGPRRDVLNRAFQIFAATRQNIAKCMDDEQARAMTNELEDAAYCGWGRGVRDLEDAFGHMVESVDAGSGWTDDHTEDLWGGSSSCFWPGSPDVDPYAPKGWVPCSAWIPDAPAAGANFINAIDKKMKELSALASDHFSLVGQAKEAKEKNSWKEYLDLLADIQKKGKKALKWLWWAPRIKAAGGQFLSGVNILEKIAKHADTVMESKNTFPDMPWEAAVGIELAATAAEGLPLFGKLYAEMFRGMPKLFASFKGMIERYDQNLWRTVQDATNH
ncbi:MAG: hypothetical protein HYR84_11665 [Planctomycetes bacterium]|nr:hypothetical protein [Planctomycetota bacterium]